MFLAKNIGQGKNWLVRISVIGILLISLASSIFAATDYTVETVPNTRLSNRFNHVSNPDHIISLENVTRINNVLNLVEDSLGIEVAVVAINSIGENDARMFATDLFKHWGLGQKNKDNGLLIQLVTEPSQRSVVFETGYGIEGVLPDAICYRLQQKYMIADLKQGNYSDGMLKGVMAVSQYLLASDYERGEMTGEASEDDDLLPFLILFIIVLGAIIVVSYMKFRPKKCPSCGKKTFAYMGESVVREATHFSEGLAEDIYRCRNCGYTEKKRHKIDRLRNNGGGGPIIMGGGGGGFSDFGGGSWGGGSSGGGGSISRF